MIMKIYWEKFISSPILFLKSLTVNTFIVIRINILVYFHTILLWKTLYLYDPLITSIN